MLRMLILQVLCHGYCLNKLKTYKILPSNNYFSAKKLTIILTRTKHPKNTHSKKGKRWTYGVIWVKSQAFLSINIFLWNANA